MATPLEKVQRERIQRKVGYDTTKKEVSKWEPIVKQNREVKHMVYPLERPTKQLATHASLTTKFKYVGIFTMRFGCMVLQTHLRFRTSDASNLEQDLDQILNTYGLDEKTLHKSESNELAQKELDPQGKVHSCNISIVGDS